MSLLGKIERICRPILRNLTKSQKPFAGPPTKWSELEAPEMGEFVDVHNINSENPHDYDILIQDVLGNELSEIADVSLSGPQKKMRTRLSHVAKGSSMVEIIDSCSRADRNIETSPDTGAPRTYLSLETMKALGIEPLESATLVKVAGYTHPCFMPPLHSHDNEVDLLGIDFMKNFWVSILPDWVPPSSGVFGTQ
ncbi:hypothetical protein V8E54_014834 [Elaphomyces granulatus]